MAIDAGLAAILGAAVGGVLTLIAAVVSGMFTAWQENRANSRAAREAKLASTIDAYEYALNVFFNKDGNPDRATRGNVFAQISLRGSQQVRVLLEEYLALPNDQRLAFDIDRFVFAMKAHIAEIEGV